MSEPNRYSDLEVWKALHFGGSTSGWVFYVDYAKLKEENARLKAEVERLRKELAESQENYHLVNEMVARMLKERNKS